MRILFDHGVPYPLKTSLGDCDVATVHERGWSTLRNGELLDLAEREEFDVFVTTDSNLRHQQNLRERKIAIIVLLSTSWPRIRTVCEEIAGAIRTATGGSVREVKIPQI